MTHRYSPQPSLARTRTTPELTTRHARRQVAGLFGVAVVLVAAVAFYVGFGGDGRGDGGIGEVQISNLVIGLTLGLALLIAGVGVVRWSRMLMPGAGSADHSSGNHAEAPAQHDSGAVRGAGLPRRRLIRNSVIGALALLPVPAVWALRQLDPLASTRREHTAWAAGVRLLTDVGYRPIRVSDLQVGELVSVMPAGFLELPDDGPARLDERATSSVVLVRMQPDELSAAKGRENWHVDGIVAYSKICTHLGCPVSLYDRTTHHLLCPCHQATFDLADNGAVLFGPATRPLPQLPLGIDDDGYLVARSDFTEPVGPGYWEREA